MTVLNLDCRVGMGAFPDNSFDAIVTDPPYELGLMGASWDSSGIAYDVAMWREALRVLKPGGHILAFSGSRTYHRMTCAIEDAGFEIRDQIMWVYGSGYPKSLNVSKAIDKAAGVEREVVGFDAAKAAQQTPKNGTGTYGDFIGNSGVMTAPATDAARQWQGWGTALKPSFEPVCVARKPLIGTVAANVLAHGTGALNIEACRVGTESTRRPLGKPLNGGAYGSDRGGLESLDRVGGSDVGRWPANLIHDGSDEVVAAFPNAKGQQGAITGDEPSNKTNNVYGAFDGRTAMAPRNDSGSAARFFYCAKASKSDRHAGLDAPGPQFQHGGTLRDAENLEKRGNFHPTVKPTNLMRYLCRLVTPPGGLILDPFAGSGSTGKAARLEGFQFVGFEMSAEYAEIANARIKGTAS